LLDETKANLKKHFPNSTIKTYIENGRPAAEILRAAKEDEFDWIILGSHGRTGLDKFFLGSVSLAVVNHAHCSVTIVRIPEPKQKAEDQREVASSAIK
jgi:nucleotide-binding universal stress UspA family protein